MLLLEFQNPLPRSTYERVPNTAETSTAAVLSYVSINLSQIEFENISLSQIWNFMTAF